MSFNFGPASADEPIVYGAARPGYSAAEVQRWVAFMKQQGIRRVCCLLGDEIRNYETDLLQEYRLAFGQKRVCHAAIEDFSYCSREQLLHVILPFLFESRRMSEPVVVHCSAGCGRTGHVLAAWLAAARAMPAEAAEDAILVQGVYRNANEAGAPGQFEEVMRWATEYGEDPDR